MAKTADHTITTELDGDFTIRNRNGYPICILTGISAEEAYGILDDINGNTGRHFVARREFGLHPFEGFTFGGRWVVRNKDGIFIDCSAYRNDLREKYSGLVVEGQ